MRFSRADAIKKAALVFAGVLGAKTVTGSVAKADGNEGPTYFSDEGYGNPVVHIYEGMEDSTALVAEAPYGATSAIIATGQTAIVGNGSDESNVGKGAILRGAIGVQIHSYTHSHIRLEPGNTNSLPEVGGVGDLYCDASGRLWFYGGQVRREGNSWVQGWKRLA